MDNITIFKTLVGSRLWNMQREDSDYDYFECYLLPTEEYLVGRDDKSSQKMKGEDDVAKHEAGIVVKGLLSGNINFFIGVLGKPIMTTDEFWELRKIVENNKARNVYKSVNGLSVRNYKKYVEGNENPKEKKVKLVLRTLELGINYYDTGKFIFEKPSYFDKMSKEDLITQIDIKVKELEDKYKESKFPESLPEKELKNWLLKTRLKYLNK